MITENLLELDNAEPIRCMNIHAWTDGGENSSHEFALIGPIEPKGIYLAGEGSGDRKHISIPQGDKTKFFNTVGNYIESLYRIDREVIVRFELNHMGYTTGWGEQNLTIRQDSNGKILHTGPNNNPIDIHKYDDPENLAKTIAKVLSGIHATGWIKETY